MVLGRLVKKLFTAIVDPLSAILRDVFAWTTFEVGLSTTRYKVFSIASGRGASTARDCDHLTPIDQSGRPFSRQRVCSFSFFFLSFHSYCESL